MKKLILFGLLALIAWKGYQHFSPGHSATERWSSAAPGAKPLGSTEAQHSAATSTQSFKCDGRTHCSHMTSRAEAEYFVRHCPNTKMDGDHDGVPCENDSRF